MGIPQLWPKAFPTTSHTPFCILYLSHFSFSSPLFWVFPPKAVDGVCNSALPWEVFIKCLSQEWTTEYLEAFYSNVFSNLWLSSLVWVWVSSHNINSSSLRDRKWRKIVLLFFKDFFFFNEDLLQYCLCFMFLDLGSQGLWDLRSPTKGQTCIPCFGSWSFNHWITKKVSTVPF